MAASSKVSLTAAFVAVANSLRDPSESITLSVSSILPPGKTHIPPKATLEFFRSIKSSIPDSESLIITTVAAGISSLVPRSS